MIERSRSLASDRGTSPVDALFPALYEELHRQAERLFRSQRENHTLQPTAIVNEAYIKLAGRLDETYTDRGRFFAVASGAIRQVLIDHARKKRTSRRGGDWRQVTLTGLYDQKTMSMLDILALDEALRKISETSKVRGQVVELRIFGGLTIKEIADALDLSPRTVDRYWEFGRAWLDKVLAEDDAGGV